MVRKTLVDYRTAWRGTLSGLAVGGVLAVVFLAGSLTGPYTALQDRLFPAPIADPGVALVAIDQRSERFFLSDNAHSWPWSNEYHARVISNLAAHRPRVLVLDMVFDHATGQHCTSETLNAQYRDPNSVELIQHCLEQKALVDSDGELESALRNARALNVPVVIACTADDEPLDRFARAVKDPSVYGAPGFVSDRSLGLPDAANAIRTVALKPARTCAANASGESMLVTALKIADGSPEFQVGGGAALVGRHRIPLAAHNEMLINFTSPKAAAPAGGCTYLLAYTNACTDAQLRDRIVVVGIKVIDADDVHAQPVAFFHDDSFCPKERRNCMADNENYGYRIMADEIGTVLGGRFIRLQPDLSILLGILLTGMLTGTVAYLLPLRRGFLAMSIGIAAYALIAIVLSRRGYLVDPLFAPAAIVIASALALAARYVIEERERLKLEGIFGQYVDPNLLDELVALDSADQLKVGGERRELSVLFIDVRGFTPASEEMSAEDVILALNEFTERCTKIVFEHGGTVDKFIGDCVMAFWNAPKPCLNHADLAVGAALHMLRSQPAAGPLSGVGIGIYTGEVVVGNVGGANRKQYTAIGDAVNTASRLCSTAPAGAILLGGSTYEQLSVKPVAELLEPVRVKGKAAPVAVYSIRISPPLPG